MVKLLLLRGLSTLPADSEHEAVIDGYLAEYAAEVPWSIGIIALAAGVGVMGIVCASRGRWSLGAMGGVIWLLALVWVWFGGDPSRDAMVAAVAALP